MDGEQNGGADDADEGGEEEAGAGAVDEVPDAGIREGEG